MQKRYSYCMRKSNQFIHFSTSFSFSALIIPYAFCFVNFIKKIFFKKRKNRRLNQKTIGFVILTVGKLCFQSVTICHDLTALLFKRCFNKSEHFQLVTICHRLIFLDTLFTFRLRLKACRPRCGAFWG